MASKERLYEVWMLYCSKVSKATTHALISPNVYSPVCHLVK